MEQRVSQAGRVCRVVRDLRESRVPPERRARKEFRADSLSRASKGNREIAAETGPRVFKEEKDRPDRKDMADRRDLPAAQDCPD